jgi:hypothetical protein
MHDASQGMLSKEREDVVGESRRKRAARISVHPHPIVNYDLEKPLAVSG